MLEVKVENCAGIDVGKKFLAVCMLTGPADRKPAEEVRRFGPSVKELERLRAWLMEKKCTETVMESTGSYWRHLSIKLCETWDSPSLLEARLKQSIELRK